MDGSIAPDLLPYRVVRFTRQGTRGAAAETRVLPLLADDQSGLNARFATRAGPVLLRFAIGDDRTVATAEAGLRLAAIGGGGLRGDTFRLAGPFGVPRTVRMLALANAVELGGFSFSTLPVRITDHGNPAPAPAPAGGTSSEIVVQARRPHQEPWPMISVGRDMLRRCEEIVFRRAPLQLELRCAPAPRPGPAA